MRECDRLKRVEEQEESRRKKGGMGKRLMYTPLHIN